MKLAARYMYLAVAGLLLVHLSVSSVALAQSQKGIPSDGRDYYLGFMRTSFDCTTVIPYQSYWILISSYYDCNVTVGYFDHQTGAEVIGSQVHIVAKNYAQVPINLSYVIVSDGNSGNLNVDGEVPEFTGIHVHADHPINVQYFSAGPDDAEMYLALPTSALGKEYVVAAAPNDDGTGAPSPARFCNNGGEPSSSFFGVIAVQDGTHVKIFPAGTTRKGFPGATSGPNNGQGTPSELDVTLQRGQVYWVKSNISSKPGLWDIDETGSQVVADQAVGVLAGCENAFNGNTNNNFADNRNMNLEMMVPTQYWTDSGYLVMPMFDSPGIDPSDNSAGDQVKMIVADKGVNGCQVKGHLATGLRSYDVPLYDFSVENNVEDGAHFYSDCGHKFAVEQYDYRGAGGSASRQGPFTAPAQMNVVSASRYRTSFMWTVPDDVRQVAKHRYINVIARSDQFSKIKVWKNGLPIGTIGNIGVPWGTTRFPDYPQLSGRRYELGVGCYYATADSAFAVYQYGMSGFDFDGDLGDWDADDFFNEYAAPCGQSFGIDGAGAPKISVDTLCSSWNLHVLDTLILDHFISAVDILDDPLGVIKKRPGSDGGYVSTNVAFDPVNYTIVPGDSTKVNPTIVVVNPLKDAEAWVWAVNGAGEDTLVHLLYTAPALAFGAITHTGPDSLAFLNAQEGVDTCSYFVFKNNGAPGSGNYSLKNISFRMGNQGFSATTDPKLPASLNPGDSVIIHVCFNATEAGRVFLDTLVAQTDCPTVLGALIGSTTLPEINATDWNFGSQNLIGKTVCHTVRVWNSGKAPFTLNKNWVMENYGTADFTFPDSTKLPVVLKPGDGIDLQFCFTPSAEVTDSSIQRWGSNIPEPFTHTKKDFSILTGAGIKPDLTWDRSKEIITTECDTVRIDTLYLRNHGSAMITIDSLGIVGLTATEWSIVEVQHGFQKNFIIGQESLPDSDYVIIKYTPDLSRGGDVVDTLIEYDEDGFRQVVLLFANTTYAGLKVSTNSIDFGTVPPNTPSGQQTITITDTGSAPLIINELSIDPPFTIVRPGSTLNLWDTILPGKSKTIIVQGKTTDPSAKGNLTINGMTNCVVQRVVALQIGTSSIGATGSQLSFVPTYVCKNSIDSVAVISSGTRNALLEKVEILPDPAYPTEVSAFQFSASVGGGQTLNLIPPVVLIPGERKTLPVEYQPSDVLPKHAFVRYTFDTADNPTPAGIWTDMEPLLGTGLQEHTVISVAADPTNPVVKFTGHANDIIQVPLHILKPIRSEAAVAKIAFDVSFEQDLFDPTGAGAAIATNGYQIVSQTESDAGGIATWHIVVHPTAKTAFDSADVIGNLSLKIMVARETSSNFVASNVDFQDVNGTSLCYVLHQEIPGVFTPIDLCGNPTERTFLTVGAVRFSIGEAHPNPATHSAQVTLDVHQDGTPMTVELFNVLGQSVRTFTTDQLMSAGTRDLDLDLTGLAGGSYTLRVTAPEQVHSQMILIQK
ncbi:MAG: choice-of-anchor D domain-containing protein [Bacteroidota bacterium]|nr:choice-of-anchor D domain-containing protein [Bacteroidota bacterium]MDP4232278.1 choice-of-anchor D domain-containing protein [Bacteroidota bacterium]MDP4241417.1 choice-of-anchor D domain-containing protein [Bacteroidota bacterium]MDP4286759.1 choice-of-anchor D domain-containing protein [Bacteroidota bacterium]